MAPCGVRSRCRSRPTSFCAGCPRWPRPIRSCVIASRGRRPMSATTVARDGARRALRWGRHERADAPGWCARRLRRNQRRGLRGEVSAFLRTRAASDPRAQLSRMRLCADDRTAGLPRGQRVHELHRLGRRPGLHAADQPGDVRHPAERVIGSATTLEYTSNDHGGTITHKAEADYLDDGPQKPIRIWSRTGRRPLLAAGNSNGDIADARIHPARRQAVLRLLVLHDDGEREFDYTSGAEQALDRADADGWTVVSMKNDWATVF